MEFLRLLESARLPALDAFFSAVTYLGDELAFMALALLLFWCVDKRTGYYVFVVGLFGTLANQFLKILCRVPRPWVLDPGFTIVESARAAATGYSFPSGHTQNAVGTFGAIGLLTKRRWVNIACLALVLLVPFSRMYLGVHTPLDVSVAFLMAAILLAAFYPIFRSEEKTKGAMPYLLAAGIALAIVFVFYVSGIRADFAPGSEDASNLAHAVKNAWTDVDAARHQNILKGRFFIDLLSLYHIFQIFRQFPGLQHKCTRIAHFFLLVKQFNLHFCPSSGIQSKNRYAMTFSFRKFIYKICLFHITENRCAHAVIRNRRKHHKSCQRSLIKRVDHCQHIFKCVFVAS